MTVTEKRDLIAMIDRWMACNEGRVPTEAENERRKCAKELNRWLRHKDRVVTAAPPAEPGARFVVEGKGLIDREGSFDRCTGCGVLPPHEGCKAICPACSPPNGTCSCPGCALVKAEIIDKTVNLLAGKPPAEPGERGCEEKWMCGTCALILDMGQECPMCGTGRAGK